MAVLHVTNGAAVAADLRSLGEVLTWDDVVFTLTIDGERVFAGEAEATALMAPLDRWVDGVHHAGAPALRWDPAARRLRR